MVSVNSDACPSNTFGFQPNIYSRVPVIDEMSPRRTCDAVPFQELDTIVLTSSCDVLPTALSLVCEDSDSETGSMRHSGVLVPIDGGGAQNLQDSDTVLGEVLQDAPLIGIGSTSRESLASSCISAPLSKVLSTKDVHETRLLDVMDISPPSAGHVCNVQFFDSHTVELGESVKEDIVIVLVSRANFMVYFSD